MARLPYLDPEQAEPRVAELLGSAPDLGIFRMVANAQRAFPSWIRFGGALFDPAELDPLVRELAITRVAAMTPGRITNGCSTLRSRSRSATTLEQLDAIRRGDLEAAVLGDDGRLIGPLHDAGHCRRRLAGTRRRSPR